MPVSTGCPIKLHKTVLKWCRARHVKCDPQNLRCHQFLTTAWHTNREPFSNGRHDIGWYRKSQGPLQVIQVLSWDGNQRERQSLDFFTVVSAPKFAGYLDSGFFERTLLQAAQNDPAIRHATTAIGAYHEVILRRQASRHNLETERLQAFAVRQYTKAIRELLKASNGTTDTEADIRRTLTASLLFSCFEGLQGNRQQGVLHVQHSRK